jgi:hypothetical protein
MSIEVSLSSVDFDKYPGVSFASAAQYEEIFHERIFSQHPNCQVVTKITVLLTARSEVEERTEKASRNHVIRNIPIKGVSAEAGVSIEWGGQKGTGVSGYVSGSAEDDRGNKAEVKVEVNDDGSGKASVVVGHDEH